MVGGLCSGEVHGSTKSAIFLVGILLLEPIGKFFFPMLKFV